MKSILDIDVSCFKNYQTAWNPKPVNLLDWLKSDKYKPQVDAIRQLSDKAKRDTLKSQLPGITPSGVFTHRRMSNLVSHTGFMAIDIDQDDTNKQIENLSDLKQQISNIKQIAYCGLSVSGTGYWALIPIEPDPKLHKAYFDYIAGIFASHWNISLDKSCKDISRLRGYSYDPEAYFNHEAVRLPPPPQKVMKPAVNASNKTQKTRTGTFEEIKDLSQAREAGLKQVEYRINQIVSTPGHQPLRSTAILMGGFVGKNIFGQSEAIAILHNLIERNSYLSNPEKIATYKQTAIDGIEHGIKNPIYPSKKVNDKPKLNWDKHLPKSEFETFETYIKGLQFKDGILINGHGYPATWDTTSQNKHIDQATKNYIEIADKNPSLLDLQQRFNLTDIS